MIALAVTVTATAVPAAAYYLTKPSNDALGDMLRRYGFVPIAPPSNLMNVGSLYYVDASVRDFKAICDAEPADIAGAVSKSRSWDMEENFERNGQFASGVKIDVGWLVNGGAKDNSVQKVHSSLTDIVLEEIPLGASWLIFAKLMKKPGCNEAVMQVIGAGGYVCQGQKILQATAEFKLDLDTQRKLDTSANIKADDVKGIVKLAIETQTEQNVVERSGRLFAGAALKYGVSMNPTCLAPPNGRFQRILPRTAFGRIANFVLFRIIEPMLPAKSDRVQVAQER
jgi:hypothetical protein